MIARACLGALALWALGCGSSTGQSQTRIDRCVDRLLTRAEIRAGDEESAREYAERAYCRRYEENGWVYADGALRIAAQQELEEGGECGAQRPGEPVRTVPCEEVLRSDPILDCALLHHVRRSEVHAYLEQLDRPAGIRCDDGTPLDELGVP